MVCCSSIGKQQSHHMPRSGHSSEQDMLHYRVRWPDWPLAASRADFPILLLPPPLLFWPPPPRPPPLPPAPPRPPRAPRLVIPPLATPVLLNRGTSISAVDSAVFCFSSFLRPPNPYRASFACLALFCTLSTAKIITVHIYWANWYSHAIPESVSCDILPDAHEVGMPK